MSSRSKVLLILTALFLFYFFSMIYIIGHNFREHGLKSAQERANLTAEIVKSGLTAHMVNGMMDKRAFFLEQIMHMENINALWLARSNAVIKQYGEGFNNEIPRDRIDEHVLQTGQVEKVITEAADRTTLRITIPYIASAFGKPNCLTCHNAQEGEVLGAVSMIVDISDIRGTSILVIILNAGLSILIMGVMLYIINYFIKPYVNIFYSIKEVMQKAYEGDYSRRVAGGCIKESQMVALMMNNLLEKLQKVFDEINTKVKIFIQDKQEIKHPDPLISINNTIDQLYSIYKFKQTIENDEELEDVYRRIGQVLQNRFGITAFSFIEVDVLQKSNRIVYTRGGCHCSVAEGTCRASRTSALVDSSLFERTCELFNEEGTLYICMPFAISQDLNLVISITAEDEAQIQQIRSHEHMIEDYITTARPTIVSKKLMQVLKEVARVDQLTGMYNRKYLDEFVDKAIPQAERTNTPYGIMMIDIDYFKMINDTYGHDIGDEAIRVVSGVIRESIRKSDVAIRFGGEEFIVMLHNCDEEAIRQIAEKIRTLFAKTKIYAGKESFTKTLSIGTSLYPKDSTSIWKCIKFADIALYRAKEQGRNRIIAFHTDMIDPAGLNEY